MPAVRLGTVMLQARCLAAAHDLLAAERSALFGDDHPLRFRLPGAWKYITTQSFMRPTSCARAVFELSVVNSQ